MISTLNFAPNRLPFRKPRIVVIEIALVLAMVVVFGAFSSSAQAQSGSRPIKNRPPGSQPFQGRPSERKAEASSEIALAREKARAAKKQFDTVKKLSRYGSASQKDLRDAEVLKRIAILDLSSLESPELKLQNSLTRAKVVFNYRSKEFAVTESLYNRGAASKLKFQRAKTARDVAKSQLKAVQSDSDAQRKIHVINAATSRYESALKEHRLAAKLMKSGSISQAVMDRADRILEDAQSDLAEAKKSLGAKAYEVQQ